MLCPYSTGTINHTLTTKHHSMKDNEVIEDDHYYECPECSHPIDDEYICPECGCTLFDDED